MIIGAALAATILHVGVARSDDPVCGDVNASGGVTSSDALAVLKKGVGQDVTLKCPPLSGSLRTGEIIAYGIGSDADVGGRDDASLYGQRRRHDHR
jgi:hypothetical protein